MLHNCPRSQQKNPAGKTCLLVSYNLCEKLVSLLRLSIIFDDNLKVTSVALFVDDFNFIKLRI